MWRRRKPNLWKGFAAGAVGGLAGSWTMNQLQALGKKFSGREGGRKRKEQGDGENATEKAAARISELVLHKRLSERQKKLSGPILHYAFGLLVGGAYGILAESAKPV